MRWAILLSAAIMAIAQEPRFKTRAREVLVPVSVTAKSGKLIEGLAANDFLVLSDGRPQVVHLIARASDAVPIHAVIVLQSTAASEAALAKIRKTAAVISSYLGNDMETGARSLVGVVTASDEVRIAQNLTADADLLQDVFEKISANGDSSRLLDAVSLACDMLAARKETARRVILLISESRDRGSKARFADVVTKAQQDDVAVYAFSYSAYTTPFTQKASDLPPAAEQPGLYDPHAAGGIPLLAIPMELARLAKVNIAAALPQATGGGHERFTTLRGLETQLAAAGNEIHNRYTLTFVPPAPLPPGYHELSVSVRRPGEFRVHARAGYWVASE